MLLLVPSPSTSPPSLAGSRRRRRGCFRTCVERGGAVRSVLGSPVIRITSCSTTSSPFFERFRSRSTRYVDASIHSLLDELLDDLGETSRKIFVFCYVPQQWHHELGLLRRFYARVEHKLLWALILFNMLTVTSPILFRRYCGMKRPGPTLHVHLRETGSTD